MDRYRISFIKYYDLGANLFLEQKGQVVRNQIVPLDFSDGVRPGNVIYALGCRDTMMTAAWVCRDRLYLTLVPISDYRLKHFISQNFDFDDGLFFFFFLFRALWARGIMPTLSGANNLRLFLGQRVR